MEDPGRHEKRAGDLGGMTRRAGVRGDKEASRDDWGGTGASKEDRGRRKG